MRLSRWLPIAHAGHCAVWAAATALPAASSFGATSVCVSVCVRPRGAACAQLSDNRKIGIMLMVCGLTFLFLGVLLVFNSGLLAMGNILFLASFPFLIGLKPTLSFFNPLQRRQKLRGILLFFSGIVLVLTGWAKIGILLEVVGMVEMFGTFVPHVVTFLRQFPYVGHVLNLPIVATVIDRLSGRRTPV
jgi:hypothetical protein